MSELFPLQSAIIPERCLGTYIEQSSNVPSSSRYCQRAVASGTLSIIIHSAITIYTWQSPHNTVLHQATAVIHTL